MSDISFKVAARRDTPITFDLQGSDHVYTFRAGKQATVFMPLLSQDSTGPGQSELQQARAMFEWLDNGLSEDDRKHLSDRLNDPEDDFDFDTLGDVVSGLMEKVTGRPTM